MTVRHPNYNSYMKLNSLLLLLLLHPNFYCTILNYKLSQSIKREKIPGIANSLKINQRKIHVNRFVSTYTTFSYSSQILCK